VEEEDIVEEGVDAREEEEEEEEEEEDARKIVRLAEALVVKE